MYNSYLNDITVFAPGLSCHGRSTRYPLPQAVTAAVAHFVGGRAVICGGARQEYHGCAFEEGDENGIQKCKGCCCW